ncbi:MAG: hypothetical protein JXA19_01240 [Anaerolineales bacterium]|nr:hypothetical protein [Anaerolineales bacterium]
MNPGDYLFSILVSVVGLVCIIQGIINIVSKKATVSLGNKTLPIEINGNSATLSGAGFILLGIGITLVGFRIVGYVHTYWWGLIAIPGIIFYYGSLIMDSAAQKELHIRRRYELISERTKKKPKADLLNPRKQPDELDLEIRKIRKGKTNWFLILTLVLAALGTAGTMYMMKTFAFIDIVLMFLGLWGISLFASGTIILERIGRGKW